MHSFSHINYSAINQSTESVKADIRASLDEREHETTELMESVDFSEITKHDPLL